MGENALRRNTIPRVGEGKPLALDLPRQVGGQQAGHVDHHSAARHSRLDRSWCRLTRRERVLRLLGQVHQAIVQDDDRRARLKALLLERDQRRQVIDARPHEVGGDRRNSAGLRLVEQPREQSERLEQGCIAAAHIENAGTPGFGQFRQCRS